jgi:hypothetical protein
MIRLIILYHKLVEYSSLTMELYYSRIINEKTRYILFQLQQLMNDMVCMECVADHLCM